MHAGLDIETARALLAWQLELGADAPVGDAPVDRYALEAGPVSGSATAAPPAPPTTAEADPVAEAHAAARGAGDLAALAAAMAAYPHCDLRHGARNCVFADGQPGARVMIVGEAPGRDEDLQGRPFVGRAGRLLDRMLAAIGLSRSAEDIARAVYITNILPWRPPENRRPTAQECAMFVPFVERHIALADPEVLVLMGNTPLQALLGESGILRLRGQWREVLGRPALPMTHPAYLLRTPSAKRAAWEDLLALSARLDAPGP
ncbi:uracil-DNA glycosylase [Rhodobaculum claviforme]|uniref:Type-4 uracil-DNA glycosylase n=1 Tax=Rhodobaculum claviforme TaxID=1549854 RepID=A0A934TL75_9RHOB|nr:uracil-DNA glycosylase [Rhodobaculum claviforme]MBK5927561.1 uracil-DNA glycosylase [Rhodobaculum claviforme]